MASRDDEHLRDAQKVDYGVRSIYVHRSIKRLDYEKFLGKLNRLNGGEFDWEERAGLGVSERAWDRAKENGIEPLFLFCNPEVITKDPVLVAYYRGIAGIPMKGIQKMAFDTTKIESGQKPIGFEKALELARIMNEFISKILEEDSDYSLRDSSLMFYATAGANLDGSWRNVKGREIADLVKRMIFDYFLSARRMKTVVLPRAKEAVPSKDVAIEQVRGFALKNGCRIEFGTEPDIALIDKKGTLTGMIEVKGGLDEAGALERYGAAKKTFDQVLNINPRAFTIYLASCITPTVRERIEADRMVRKIFNLTNVLFDEKQKREFLKEIRWWMRL